LNSEIIDLNTPKKIAFPRSFPNKEFKMASESKPMSAKPPLSHNVGKRTKNQGIPKKFNFKSRQ
jgi:hypothetical protein